MATVLLEARVEAAARLLAMPELAVPRVSEEALEEVQVLEEALGEAPLAKLEPLDLQEPAPKGEQTRAEA